MATCRKKSLDSEVFIQLFETMSLSQSDELTQRQQQKRLGFILLKAGNGQLLINDRQYKIEHDVLYCVPSGHWHQLLLDGKPKGFLLLLPEAFLHVGNDNVSLRCRATILELFKRQTGLRIGAEGARAMEEIVYRMVKQCNERLFRVELVKAYGGIFLVQLARQVSGCPNTDSQTNHIELAEKLIALVAAKYLVWRRVTDYASVLDITPNYLNEIVKRVSGDTVSGHIRRRIVLEAKRKAIHDHSSMKEIAFCLGFKDIAHFSKFFKLVHGKNFSAFKREA
jgi:AraC family transcriptional regulator, transcriptional activator of pobA